MPLKLFISYSHKDLAGFRFEAGLVNQLLTDAHEKDNRRGVVPLLECALAKLYQPFTERRKSGEPNAADARCFTANDYAAFGGIRGAIGTAANQAVAAVADAARVLPELFGALVTLSTDGKPTRRACRGGPRNPVRRLARHGQVDHGIQIRPAAARLDEL